MWSLVGWNYYVVPGDDGMVRLTVTFAPRTRPVVVLLNCTDALAVAKALQVTAEQQIGDRGTLDLLRADRDTLTYALILLGADEAGVDA